MDLKASSVKADGSPSDCTSNAEEFEFSDEDDDDRNHKHRRRENHTQYSERDSMEPVFTRPYRNHNKQFDNVHPFRENCSRTGETWKNYNTNSQEKNFTTKFDKRRLGSAPSTRWHLDTNQRTRPNQTFAVETGMGGRGRGRGSGQWDYFDSRINLVDIASQMAQQGPVAPGLFAGRSLPNISTTPNASWSTFGLNPGMPNGFIEPIHDMQGTLRPPINSSLNMGIPRQRCRDFEELGYCLRGDMCPMEHGVNRIVVEDVQSLSQLNLRVSLPGAQQVGTHIGTGPFMSVCAPSTSLINNKGINSKTNKLGGDDRLGNGVCSGSGDGAEYDPDQPLWNSSGPETSNALLELQPHSNDETDSLLGADPFGSHHIKLHASASRGHHVRSTGIVAGSQTTITSVSGGTDSSKNRLLMKEKIGSPLNSTDYFEGDRDALVKSQGKPHQQKQLSNDETSPKSTESAKKPGVQMRTVRKPSQKALCTLFVNGIPQNSNKKKDLLSHFRKFGTVIDVYIPAKSERAFVQFSKQEEAEAALRAPDAVMGNRFIKLLWANRDNISDDGNRTSLTFHSATAFALPPHSSTATKSKDNAASVGPKGISAPPVIVESAASKWPSSNQSKPVNLNSPKVPPPQKKLETLELMKEELRKKQELLEQKRNDFRRQLEKLAKQTAGTEPVSKRHKSRVAVDGVKANAIPGLGVSDQDTEMTVYKNVAVDNVLESSPKSKALLLEESSTSKQLIRSSILDPLLMNRNKSDDGPSTFRILSPVPAGLANVAALTEHFLPYGDLLSVEVEDFGSDKDDGEEFKKPESSAAVVNFATHHSAEKAFENGKLWQGNSLQFMWVTPIPPSNDTNDSREICSSDLNHCADDMDVRYGEILASKRAQEAPSNEGREHKKSESNGDKLENIQPSRSPTFIGEELRKNEPSVSGEDKSKCTSSQLTASEEKGSPEENDC